MGTFRVLIVLEKFVQNAGRSPGVRGRIQIEPLLEDAAGIALREPLNGNAQDAQMAGMLGGEDLVFQFLQKTIHVT